MENSYIYSGLHDLLEQGKAVHHHSHGGLIRAHALHHVTKCLLTFWLLLRKPVYLKWLSSSNQRLKEGIYQLGIRWTTDIKQEAVTYIIFTAESKKEIFSLRTTECGQTLSDVLCFIAYSCIYCSSLLSYSLYRSFLNCCF